jgi:hypothetical protein
MSKFDTRYNEILNEAGFFKGLASAAKTAGSYAAKGANLINKTASAVGSGINAAQKPFTGVKTLIQGVAGYDKHNEERAKEPISAKNPVGKGEIVQCNTTVYFEGDRLGKDGKPIQKLDAAGKPIPKRDDSGNFIIDPDTKRPALELEQGWATEDATVEGITLDKSDVQGNFDVKLNTPDMVFIQYPYNMGGVVKLTTVIGKRSKLPKGTKLIGTDGSTTKVGQSIAGVTADLKNWYLKVK